MKKHLPKKNLRFLLLGFGLALGVGVFDFLVQILALSRQEQLAEILRSWDPVFISDTGPPFSHRFYLRILPC